MRFPKLPVQNSTREMVDTFRGYNHNLRIGDGEFYDMKNMVSDDYPVLSVRGKRGVYATPEKASGLIAKDSLCYVDGSNFVMGEQRIDLGLSTAEADCPKQLVSMGAYVIIMPDKKYINTMDTSDCGNIEATFTTLSDATFELCSVDGENYEGATVSTSEPTAPKNLDLWIDTSNFPHTLKKYSASSASWVAIATTYIKITSEGIGNLFKQYDGVSISGIISDQLQDLNSTMVVYGCGADYLIVVGILDEVTTQKISEGAITVAREMPELDYITESENRLWGCRYGVSTIGAMVNEIYACKLGDFKNWNCFMGISTDSYAASCGSDGPFTGAITHLGYPLFFKEGCVHKVYGNYPANYQIQTTVCRGVQKGCERSLSIVGEILYYKARHAVCAYDGSLPVEISEALGDERYDDAVACAHGNKYYISMRNIKDGMYSLFVYDTSKAMWHREDELRADCFCSYREELYCIRHDDGAIITMLGSGKQDADDIRWMVETGELGINSPDMKYISRLTVRMNMDMGARTHFYAQYDHERVWESLATVRGSDLRSFSIPLRPRRCDYMKLRIEGTGGAKIYSITKTIEQGSELS